MEQHRNGLQSAIGNRRSAIRRGFTLVELLVVIGIIVLLVGILLPVVNGVRKSAYTAASAQQISRLTSAIEAYYGDHRAYPGPLSNEQVISGTPSLPTGLTAPVTMSENAVLGLIGGLKPTLSANPVEFDIERTAGRLGPMSLNPVAPKGGRPYIEVAAAEISLPGDLKKPAKYESEFGGPPAEDSIVPEFLDHFPDSLPVLYYRARKGANGVISDKNKPAAYQYDIGQNLGYLKPLRGPSGIGGAGPHGLTTVTPEKLINEAGVEAPQAPWGTGNPKSGAAPYNAFTYFANPQLTPAGSTSGRNASGTARQKDGYILISPGKDRVYGTRDDVTNFGGVQ